MAPQGRMKKAAGVNKPIRLPNEERARDYDALRLPLVMLN
jgi:hypothetical protein